MGEQQNPSYPFNVAPTNVDQGVILDGEDYTLKVTINVLERDYRSIMFIAWPKMLWRV